LKSNIFFLPRTLPSLVSYAYDPVGNRLSKTEDGSTTSYQYNAANQMLRAGDITYAYDANGNRIAETGLDGEAQYEYNANNYLVEYTSAEGRSTRYGYDGLNRRVYKAEGKNVLESYLYDGLDVLLELAGPKGQHATTYYRANGRIVAQQKFSAAGNNGGYRHRPEGRRLYYTYDALGSVASLSNHKGKSKTRYVYDVFGEVLSGDLKENTYTFTGKRFDMESGTYHFHFRQYDAKVGVWTTPDPIGILGGLNVYSYVENNPLNYKDPLGLWSDMGEGYGGDLGDSSEVEGPGSYSDSTPENTADGGYGWDAAGNWSFTEENNCIGTWVKTAYQQLSIMCIQAWRCLSCPEGYGDIWSGDPYSTGLPKTVGTMINMGSTGVDSGDSCLADKPGPETGCE